MRRAARIALPHDPSSRRLARGHVLVRAPASLRGHRHLRPHPASRPRIEAARRRAPTDGWRSLRQAAKLSLLGHVVLALLLLGSYRLEESKPQPPRRVVSHICDQRFQIVKDDPSVQIPLCTAGDGLRAADSSIDRAVIVIHGRNRNALNSQAAIDNAVATSGRHGVLVLAPQFLTDEDVEALDPKPDVVIWKSAWSEGDRSGDAASSARVSSYDALDKLVEAISEQDRFPNLRKIIVAEHSAGGQFVQRYAAGTRIEQQPSILSRHIELKYIVANPASYLYLFPHEARRGYHDCRGIHQYKYGLEDLNGYMRAAGAEQIRASYPQKQVTLLLGRLDHNVLDPVKDDSCEASAQGAHRLNRGIRFVGELDKHYGAGQHNTRLVIVPGAGHSAWAMFNSPAGRDVFLGT